MLGLGWPEILLIGIVAVLVIGPKELPAVMRQLGAWSRKARMVMNEFRQHWDDLPNQAGLQDMQKQADELQKETFRKFNVEKFSVEPLADEEEDNANIKADAAAELEQKNKP
jgi:sec-independent protein translocase protein TatB